MKTILLYICVILTSVFFSFKNNDEKKIKIDNTPPKLVIGIVVDQMRVDYIYRFWNKYSENGFKRLLKDGFFCKNTHFNYMPTYTGPGHTSIYTGTTPSVHGIISNNWYNKETGADIYCAFDNSVKSVTTAQGTGNRSPLNMLTTTVTDELRLSNNKMSKVIGLSIKDRSAIFPAGHVANAAYWMANDGSFMTSTYYMNELPSWVINFNKLELSKKYTSVEWNTLLPISQYTESYADDNIYEGLFEGEQKPVFPHNIPLLAKGKTGFGIIAYTPWGNTLVKDFAIEAIKNEKMGQRNITDFLCVSFSSTDIIGHMYGPQSIEIEDTYLRLDKDIADLLDYVTNTVGQQNALVFLTADHAVSPVSQLLTDNKIPSGLFDDKDIYKKIKAIAIANFGDENLVSSFTNQQVFLNNKLILEKKVDRNLLIQKISEMLMNEEGVSHVINSSVFLQTQFLQAPLSLLQNGFYPKRSGDIIVNFEPGWMDHGKTGTTHGSPYSYDTHVPLIWWGWNIKQGNSIQHINITDIAPTLSQFLNISYPNGCTGTPIIGLTK